jgi:selenocysteine lyase/cysteine desulfurase
VGCSSDPGARGGGSATGIARAVVRHLNTGDEIDRLAAAVATLARAT